MPIETPTIGFVADLLGTGDSLWEHLASWLSVDPATATVGGAAIAAAFVFAAGMLTMRLLSPRASALAALRECDARFRKLAEASFDAVFVVEDNRITSVHGAAAKL
jgi:PAS domain-containing protein